MCLKGTQAVFLDVNDAGNIKKTFVVASIFLLNYGSNEVDRQSHVRPQQTVPCGRYKKKETQNSAKKKWGEMKRNIGYACFHH